MSKRAEIAAKRARLFEQHSSKPVSHESEAPEDAVGKAIGGAEGCARRRVAHGSSERELEDDVSVEADHGHPADSAHRAVLENARMHGGDDRGCAESTHGDKMARVVVQADASSAAAAASAGQDPRITQLIDDHLTCSICKKVMIQCVALPCSHMFCRYCIGQCFYASGRKKCAVCRVVHTRATLMRVQHMDRLIESVVCVSPATSREHLQRVHAADAEYAELQERIKKDHEEKEAQDWKDEQEAVRLAQEVSESESEDEEFEEGRSESDSDEDEEEEEEPSPPPRSRMTRMAHAAGFVVGVAAAAVVQRVTRGQKRKH